MRSSCFPPLLRSLLLNDLECRPLNEPGDEAPPSSVNDDAEGEARNRSRRARPRGEVSGSVAVVDLAMVALFKLLRRFSFEVVGEASRPLIGKSPTHPPACSKAEAVILRLLMRAGKDRRGVMGLAVTSPVPAPLPLAIK